MSNSPESPAAKVAETMPALAAAFVEAGRTAGLLLDYLPRTLPIADKFAKTKRVASERLAAYLGEVIRRETNGVWFESDGTPLIDIGLDYYPDPSAIARGLLEDGRAQAAGETIGSSKAYCELVTHRQSRWLDNAVLGRYESIAALRTSMSPDAKTAGLIVGLSRGAVLLAKLDWDEELDASVDSLDAVERILGAMHRLVAGETPQVSTEQIDALSRNLGVYAGEIIRRHYGGQWQLTPDGALHLHIGSAAFQPVAKVRKRIIEGAAENIRMYFNSMQKALSS